MSFRGRVAYVSELVADVITGAVVQTAAAGQRVAMRVANVNGSTSGRVEFYSGSSSETAPGYLNALAIDNGHARLTLEAPTVTAPAGATVPSVQLDMVGSGMSAYPGSATVAGDLVQINGGTAQVNVSSGGVEVTAPATFDSSVTVDGNLSVSAVGAPALVQLQRDSSAPAGNDVLGMTQAQGRNSAGGTWVKYAQVDGQIVSPTAGAEGGAVRLLAMVAGTLTRVATFQAPGGDGTTGMFVMVNAGGVQSVRRVTVGAADSGGTGYRTLTVPN